MVEIVRATPEQWEMVRDIRLRALADAPDSFSVTLAEATEQPEETWRERLSGPHPTFLALDEGRAMAMGGVFSPPDSQTASWVWGMWTDPAFRGRGVGRRILGAAIACAQDAGRTPYLHVTEGNDAARALYVSCGFEPTGEWQPLRQGSDLRIEELALRRG